MSNIRESEETALLCPYCQSAANENFETGAEFPMIEYDDLFYIRKTGNAYFLCFESETIDNSTRIYYCPICGRELL